VDPSSTLPAEISNAIQAYYKGASVELKIGSVVAGNVPAALQPTEFKMFKQQQPNGSDSCILFLIKTNGPGGNMSPLDAYPLGADVSAALILSDRTIFDGIIPLTKLPDGLSFASKESNGQRSVTLNGTVNCGTYGDDYNDGFSPGYSCNQYGQFSSVYLPLNGLEIHPANGGLAGGAKYSWTLYYMEWYLMHTATFRHQLDLQGSVSLSLQPTVDPDTCVVSFKGSVPVDVSGGDDFFTFFSLGSHILKDTINTTLDFLRNMHWDISTYALQNIIFPGEQRVRMGNVAFDGSLTLRGQVTAPLVVTPPSVTLRPGQQQQFSVKGSPPVSWQLRTGPGTITTGGVYTAPSTIRRNQVVVVEAVCKDKTSAVGYALAVVADAPVNDALSITPGRLTLATSTDVYLRVTDGNGNPVDATLSLDPGAPGSVSRDLSGQWVYSSPADVGGPTKVLVHATHGGAKGFATLEVVKAASSPVTVTASPSTLAARQTATLAVQGLAQAFYAASAGTISVNNDVVTYTAPSVDDATDVLVLAYGTTDDGSVGAATTQIRVTKP
jgi:hypothetical protein